MICNKIGLLLLLLVYCFSQIYCSPFGKLYTGPNNPPTLTAQYWRETLDLQLSGGGGYFKLTYISNETTSDLPKRYGGGKRPLGVAMYYLLEHADINPIHVIKSDVLWHFYYGKPVTLYIFKQNGELEVANLGPRQDDHFQFLVPHDSIVGGRLQDSKPGDYGLFGTTATPGYALADYILLNRTTLMEKFPQHKDLIISLTD